MPKSIIIVNSIPAAGPYSHAVEAGQFVFCSGQIPLDPQTGTIIIDDIGAATEQVLKSPNRSCCCRPWSRACH